METILVTGGTGLIGKALSAELVRQGYRLIILTRDPSKQHSSAQVEFALWDPKKGVLDGEAFSKADHIIHLAGANVGEGRWTESRKKEIIDSRVKGGELLVNRLSSSTHHIKTVVSASAIGYYGPDTDIPRAFTETDEPNNDFLGKTVQLWEESIEPVQQLGIRLVVFRTGIALSNEGGAYPEFKKTLPLGVAPILGDGKQIVSWIHIHDLVRIYAESIQRKDWSGIYNAVAPQAVSNQELMKTLVRVRNQHSLKIKVPALMLKAMLGEMSIEVLKSTTVSSARLEAAGFHFQYPTIEKAIRQLEGA